MNRYRLSFEVTTTASMSDLLDHLTQVAAGFDPGYDDPITVHADDTATVEELDA